MKHSPKFLFANPQITKSKGPFCIHTHDPMMVCALRPEGERFDGAKFSYASQIGFTIHVLNVGGKGVDDSERIEQVCIAMASWIQHRNLFKP